MSASPKPAHEAPAAENVRARRMVLLLALLFFGPLVLAFVLYYTGQWRPPGHTNHGELITPPRPLASAVLKGKWSLVYVGPGSCDADCRHTLYYMRQTHLGLGRLYTRVQRVFLATAPCCDRAYLMHEYPALITVNAAASADKTLLSAFPPAKRPTGIFIVDPRGNLMMRYDTQAPPKGLLEDLQNLLGLSSIG